MPSDEIKPVKENEEDEEDENNAYNYDGGISTAYDNSDLELFILKKILLENRHRGDYGFFAKEFSFDNNTLEEICRVINRLIEDRILYLGCNSRPESQDKEEGIEDKNNWINWKLVKKLEAHPNQMDTEDGTVIFEFDMDDEVKLKGRLDIAIEEFMNDKIYTPLGEMIDKSDIGPRLAIWEQQIEQEKDEAGKKSLRELLIPKKISYSYNKQREILINSINKDNEAELIIPLNNLNDPKVEVFKTLLALEKENFLRIIKLENNPPDSICDKNGNFGIRRSLKDNPFAKIHILKTSAVTQEPFHIIIDEAKLGVIATRSDEAFIIKNKKRLYPPHFQATLWSDVTIQFLDEQNVLITGGNKRVPANYEGLGFSDDKGKKPNTAWRFLLELAKRNGETIEIPSPIPDVIKQQKRTISDRLKTIFQNDTDPFYNFTQTNTYKTKFKILPPVERETIDDFGVKKDYKERTPFEYGSE